MQTFEDAQGRKWTISIDPINVDLVRSKHDVDLFEVGAVASQDDPRDSVEWQLTGNPLLLCRVLFDLVSDGPADETFESFARQIKGDALYAARDALWSEIVNFTPDPAERRVRQTMQENLKVLTARGMDRIYGMLKSPDLARRFEEELNRLDDSFGSLLADLGSTQGDSPPASSP